MIIPGRLPGLNEYVKSNRTNRYAGGKMKKDAESMICLYIPPWPTYEKPVEIKFFFYEPSAKRDIDNISAFAHKVILDSLVAKKVLRNDSQRYVKAISDQFYVDKENPRIVVEIYEITT